MVPPLETSMPHGTEARLAHPFARLGLSNPVFDLEGRYSLELGHIIGHADSVDRARVGGNQHVMRTDRRPLSFERDPYRGVDALDVGLERFDRQGAEYGLDLTRKLSGAAFGCAVTQFAGHDDAGEDVLLAHVGYVLRDWTLRLSYEVGQDVRVEQVQLGHVRGLPALPRGVGSTGSPHRAAGASRAPREATALPEAR